MEVSTLPQRGGGFLPRSRRVLATLDDARLVDQLRRGNDAAFEVIFDRHHPAILSFCRHMLRSLEEAEDAVQHAFISAYDDLRRSDKEINLKPWLYAIARNRCLSMLRARREQVAQLDEVPVAGFSDEVQRRDELRSLVADMQELPDDQRAALVLSELGDLSHAEIGAVVGCETMKVKSLVFQARSSLIEARDARDIPCRDIREQLATATGGALRRGPLRKHLRACSGCREFRDDVQRQRAMVAALLPVVPTLGLKSSVLGSLGLAPAAAAPAGALGGGAASGGLTGGGAVTAAGAGGAAKLAVVALALTTAVGGGAAVKHLVDTRDHGSPSSTALVTVPDASAAPVAHLRVVGRAPGAAIALVARRHSDLVSTGLGRGAPAPAAADAMGVHAHPAPAHPATSARDGAPGHVKAKHQAATGRHRSAGGSARARSRRHSAAHRHGGASGRRARHSATHRHVKPPAHATTPTTTTTTTQPAPSQTDGTTGDHPDNGTRSHGGDSTRDSGAIGGGRAKLPKLP